MQRYFIGVDWGGTRIKYGAVAENGALLSNAICDTQVAADIDASFNALTDRVAALLAETGPGCAGLGIGLTGVVDPERGVAFLPGKINGIEGYPIVAQLREQFSLPVYAGNDGVMALYAEKTLGHARGKSWAVVLTIGTGIGSGVMLDGRILDDPRFMFGAQAGHFVIDASHGQLCLTGARGTGEILCSATALVLAVRSGLQRGIPSSLTEDYWRETHSIDFKSVIERGVACGDRLCLDELQRWTTALGWLLVNVVHAYSPEVIVLAGGATAAARHFLPALTEQVNRHIFRYPPGEPVPILVSQLGDHVGVQGAAMMTAERLRKHDKAGASI